MRLDDQENNNSQPSSPLPSTNTVQSTAPVAIEQVQLTPVENNETEKPSPVPSNKPNMEQSHDSGLAGNGGVSIEERRASHVSSAAEGDNGETGDETGGSADSGLPLFHANEES